MKYALLAVLIVGCSSITEPRHYEPNTDQWWSGPAADAPPTPDGCYVTTYSQDGVFYIVIHC